MFGHTYHLFIECCSVHHSCMTSNAMFFHSLLSWLDVVLWCSQGAVIQETLRTLEEHKRTCLSPCFPKSRLTEEREDKEEVLLHSLAGILNMRKGYEAAGVCPSSCFSDFLLFKAPRWGKGQKKGRIIQKERGDFNILHFQKKYPFGQVSITYFDRIESF